MHDEVTSVAPSFTVSMMLATDPSFAGNHVLERKLAVFAGGHIVRAKNVRDPFAVRRQFDGIECDRHTSHRFLSIAKHSFHLGPGEQLHFFRRRGRAADHMGQTPMDA